MCVQTIHDMADPAARCVCREAAMRAYHGLIKAGQPQNFALEAAKIIYRHHHPEDSPEIRNVTVERWVTATVH
jgi:hypothetical protein